MSEVRRSGLLGSSMFKMKCSVTVVGDSALKSLYCFSIFEHLKQSEALADTISRGLLRLGVAWSGDVASEAATVTSQPLSFALHWGLVNVC